MWAILQAQDIFFFYGITDECTEELVGQSRGWILLEIISFWLTFIGAFLFIIIAMYTIRETGLEFRQKKEHRVDFLNRYETLCGVFQTYFIMLGTTIAAAVVQTVHVRDVGASKNDKVSGNIVFYAMVTSHFF